MSFSSLGLSEKVLAAVEAAGYTEPTAIQAGAIPHVLERRDVLGLAQTGTGKTASFTLPMLTLLEKGRARARMPRTLILEPTRELAAQVEENFNKYGVNHKLNVALLIGGTSFGDQDRKLDRGVDVLIATPGRLLDHTERGKLLLQGVDILVIDEADRMLDMGFIPDIERICKLIPMTRQTLFFSATMPPEIQRLVDTFLHNPARIEVARTSSTADTVSQHVIGSGSKDFDKRATLRKLIDQAEDLKNAIVFCNRKRDVQTVFRSLQRHEYSVGALHGDMDQRSRMATLDQFRNGDLALLIASDVAARGLDIPDVSHVFNYDVPTHAEDYVHRIGRTGRAGRTGSAVSIVTGNDAKYLTAIEKLIDRSLPWIGEPIDFEAAAVESKSRRRGGAGRGASDKSADAEQGGEKSATRGRSNAKDRAAKKEETASRPARPRREAKSDQPQAQSKTAGASKRKRGGSQKGEERVIGLGDHVPAFLLRDPRPKKAG
ncbi:DEAD/DEAH box helicase [Stappia taiwanensis]|uniref:DEAD-box ATP-dependent RNA helicase RhpA n=1 Tax=Stappia taiwanensis TaxID=992267 RepID=A0A838XSH6_9HYPH|nr:DEAD/DEAH box helicase [Stappia taiwanensis]MBA4613282.1 DEAD/DEAH box helicase [Stappia taiwanensis]GGE80860.1 DEAD/DEAH box helicase [Stappia taiwanensis]